MTNDNEQVLATDKFQDFNIETVRVRDYLAGNTVKFRVVFDPVEAPHGVYYDEHAQARQAIAEHRKTEAKQKKLALPVLQSDGTTAVITGINIGNCKLLLKSPTASNRRGDSVYPDVPWVKDALTLQKQLSDASNQVYSLVGKLKMSTTRGYGYDTRGYGYGRLSPEQYLERVALLEAQHKELTEQALGPKAREWAALAVQLSDELNALDRLVR